MADAEYLTHAYLSKHPADAARVLEALASDDASALFDRVPARLGAPVLAAMRPYAAARVLPADEARSAMLLTGTGVAAAAAILRYVPEARRAALIDALPTAFALACRALLGYPEDAVGAIVDTEVVALMRDHRVRHALDALRDARVKRSLPVYVVDGQRRPLGHVDPVALLQVDADTRLDLVMSDLPAALPALMPVSGAYDHPVWDRADVVPVVERDGALVGAIDRRALRRAHRGRIESKTEASGSVAALVGTAYWNGIVALIESALAGVAAPRRERP